MGDRGTDESYIGKLIAEADFKGDGRICYEEFLQVFSKRKHDNIKELYEDGNTSSHHSTDEILRKHGLIESLRRGFSSGGNIARNVGNRR